MANPATDWAELDAPDEDTRESRLRQGELKAMIERKRRNDFVRKREFDMLRKMRREGLSPEQLAALGGSSRLDDSERAHPDSPARQDAGVKAKIDEIEQQMVGDDATPARSAAAPEFYNAPTQPAPIDMPADRGPRAAARADGGAVADAPAADGLPLPRARRRRQRPSSAAPAAAPLARGDGAAGSSTAAPAVGDARRRRSARPIQPARGQRGRPRPRARRGGDRLRQRRLRRSASTALHRS